MANKERNTTPAVDKSKHADEIEAWLENEFAPALEAMYKRRMDAAPEAVRRARWGAPLPNGVTPEIPRKIFKTMECDGVRVGFFPGWDMAGRFAGWNIVFENTIARQISRVNNALRYALKIKADVTEELWRDLNPAKHSGRDVVLQCLCPDETVERFIKQAKRNGFRPVEDAPEQPKGHAQ